jgi:hypothetical protein
MQFYLLTSYLALLKPKYLPLRSTPEHPQPMLLIVSDQNPHPYKATGIQIAFYQQAYDLNQGS